MALLILSLILGGIAGLLLPSGVEPGAKYEPPSEEGFKEFCKHWNIK